jgi:hypothetical protein
MRVCHIQWHFYSLYGLLSVDPLPMPIPFDSIEHPATPIYSILPFEHPSTPMFMLLVAAAQWVFITMHSIPTVTAWTRMSQHTCRIPNCVIPLRHTTTHWVVDDSSTLSYSPLVEGVSVLE